MTENQRKYLEYLENQRHNLAMEEVNAGKLSEEQRSNLAQESEINRANVAREKETRRANTWDQIFTAVNTAIKGYDTVSDNSRANTQQLLNIAEWISPG